jgi:hypothetical protein
MKCYDSREVVRETRLSCDRREMLERRVVEGCWGLWKGYIVKCREGRT